MKAFAIYDSKTEFYSMPIFCRSFGEAVRIVSQAATNPQSTVSISPGDFTLFEIGEWDDQKGLYTMYDHKINLGCLIELKALERDNGGLREVGDAP